MHLELERPDGERLSRGMPLIKWLLALPHYILLVFLWLAAVVVVIFAWFAILFTGRYPRGLFDFVLGVVPLGPPGGRRTRSCSSPTSTHRSGWDRERR